MLRVVMRNDVFPATLMLPKPTSHHAERGATIGELPENSGQIAVVPLTFGRYTLSPRQVVKRITMERGKHGCARTSLRLGCWGWLRSGHTRRTTFCSPGCEHRPQPGQQLSSSSPRT